MIRVLVADDERVECDALEKMIREHFPEAELLPSVYDGLGLVEAVKEKRPDIAIVDINMPGMSGLDALELLREEHDGLEIIMHTAYSDFGYAKRALRLGAADYLVKPVFEEDFVSVFRPVLARVREKQAPEAVSLKERRLREDMRRITEKNLMMSLLLGRPEERSWEELEREAAVRGEEQPKTPFAVSVAFDGGRDKEILYEALAGELKKRFGGLSLVYRDALCLLLFHGEESVAAEQLRRFAMEHGVSYRAGISGGKESFSEFADALGEAEAAREGAGENTCVFFRAADGVLREDRFAWLAEPLGRLLAEGKEEEALTLLTDRLEDTGKGVGFWEGFFAQRLLARVAAALKMDRRRTGAAWTLPALCAGLTGSGGQEGPWQTEQGLTARVPVEVFTAFLKKELAELTAALERPVRGENAYVNQALLYLRQHYREDVSLEQIAEQVGITQFYLSRLLKQECAQTFLELLTRERLTHALSALLEPSRSIQSVSASVGYAPKYFYQIFRKTFGFSLRDFRDAMFTGGVGAD